MGRCSGKGQQLFVSVIFRRSVHNIQLSDEPGVRGAALLRRGPGEVAAGGGGGRGDAQGDPGKSGVILNTGR